VKRSDPCDPGLHNVRNRARRLQASGASAVGVPAKGDRRGLAAFRPYVGSCRSSRQCGMTVIDDSYNANPDSVRAAIDVLAPARALRCWCFGDMGEVGHGADFHREIGFYARSKGISNLLALGDEMRHAVEAFGRRTAGISPMSTSSPAT